MKEARFAAVVDGAVYLLETADYVDSLEGVLQSVTSSRGLGGQPWMMAYRIDRSGTDKPQRVAVNLRHATYLYAVDDE